MLLNRGFHLNYTTACALFELKGTFAMEIVFMPRGFKRIRGPQTAVKYGKGLQRKIGHFGRQGN